MRTDLHSHILPEMDDGAKNTEESVKLLEMLADSGVDAAVLTPHFYRSDEDIASFLKRRDRSYKLLSSVCGGIKNCPRLILGAEVYFYPFLPEDPDFYRLCTENTDFILLELPFDRFDDNFFRNYANFLNRCEQKIILAHLERYLRFGNTPDDLARLFEYGNVIAQMNCSSLAGAGLFKRKTLLKLITDGMISALGTDAHNISHRPPEYTAAERIITSKCGGDTFADLCRASEMILENKSVGEILGR